MRAEPLLKSELLMRVSAVVADVPIEDIRPCPYYHSYAERQN